MSSGNNQQPSLIGGHAEYVKGAAEATIGNVTGSEPWKASGEQAKAHAVDTMKAAGEQRDASKGFGSIEQKAGALAGCEGMEKEGAASKKE
ncbi:Uu.00g058860.m01.CDS01 [Anthostomella pinea]|uniref:Uu.00g058860.m01.CDS01 n=1 Tax=Anthostomella pinea TaxID=933095 RepID=A0AAI8VRW0_9PEZI|nr:Uu.00g058860.m01.CDS01 [Anthostomella pinea]